MDVRRGLIIIWPADRNLSEITLFHIRSTADLNPHLRNEPLPFAAVMLLPDFASWKGTTRCFFVLITLAPLLTRKNIHHYERKTFHHTGSCHCLFSVLISFFAPKLYVVYKLCFSPGVRCCIQNSREAIVYRTLLINLSRLLENLKKLIKH